MDGRELQIIEVPFSRPNEFGVTVLQGKFDPLKIKFPVPREGEIGFGTFFTVFNNEYRIHEAVLLDSQAMPIEFVLQPYHLRFGWQQLYYTFVIGGYDRRISRKLNVLLEYK